MRPALCGWTRGAGPRLPSEDADLHFGLALLQVHDAANATFADEQGSQVGPYLLAVDDLRCCEVVSGALLVVRCHFLTPCFEAAGAPLSPRISSGAGLAFAATQLGRCQRLISAASRQRP